MSRTKFTAARPESTPPPDAEQEAADLSGTGLVGTDLDGMDPGEAGLDGTGLMLARDLRRVGHSLDVYSKRVTATTGLTLSQLVVLHALRELGPCSAGTLSKAASISGATLTMILDRLAARGLITRLRDDRDRRQVRAVLTPAGAALLSDAPPLLPVPFLDAMAALPLGRTRAIARAVKRLADLLETTRG